MNPESLARYKQQVYNPGSPYPTPSTEPFKAFPAVPINDPSPEDQNQLVEDEVLPTVEITDPENPLKVTIRKGKRKADNIEHQPSPNKRSKMMNKEEVHSFFEEFRTKYKEDMKELKDDNKQSFNTFEKNLNTMSLQFTGIQAQLAALAESQSNLVKTSHETNAKADSRFKAIEDKIERLEHASQASGCVNDGFEQSAAAPEVPNTSSDSSWKAFLAREVFEAEHGLIVHGLRMRNSNEDDKKT